MKRLLQIVAAPVTGVIIVLAGFVYDVLFAGIPYQDPTPEMQARYDFHSSVAGWFYKTGGIVLIFGLLAIPVVVKKTRRHVAGNPPNSGAS
jgi:hypothetical protein